MICAGDWVEVRSKDEILATLDRDGRCELLPFMPQQFEYCGKQFKVVSRADKTCDTVSGAYVGRRIENTVHLEHRCDGRAYGGCQAGCLIFWKEAWLKPVIQQARASALATSLEAAPDCEHATEADVIRATRMQQPGPTRYSCQATRLLEYTAPLKWWDPRQYVQAYRSGNIPLPDLLRGLVYLLYYYGTFVKSERFGGLSRQIYNRFQSSIWGGLPLPSRTGKIPAGQLTPRQDLNLRPGELVRMKSYEAILATIDEKCSNRGLNFDAEFAPFCGRVFRVDRRIDRFVDERTGLLRTLKTPAVILDGVYCKSLFAGQRMFCPRAIFLWCREIWLERVQDSATSRSFDSASSGIERPCGAAAAAAPGPKRRDDAYDTDHQRAP